MTPRISSCCPSVVTMDVRNSARRSVTASSLRSGRRIDTQARAVVVQRSSRSNGRDRTRSVPPRLLRQRSAASPLHTDRIVRRCGSRPRAVVRGNPPLHPTTSRTPQHPAKMAHPPCNGKRETCTSPVPTKRWTQREHPATRCRTGPVRTPSVACATGRARRGIGCARVSGGQPLSHRPQSGITARTTHLTTSGKRPSRRPEQPSCRGTTIETPP